MTLLDQVLQATPATQVSPIVPAVQQAPQLITKHTSYDTAKTEVFSVDKLPINSVHGEIKGKKGIFVGQRCINVVSDKYELHQPGEIIETFKNTAQSVGLTPNRIVLNPQNGGLLLSANYAGVKIVGENHDANLVFYTSHCGKFRTFLTLNLLRIACFNQVPTLHKNKSRFIFAEKHYQNALDLARLSRIVSELPAQIEQHNQISQKLIDKKLSFSDFMEFWQKREKLNETQKQFASKVEKMRETYYNAPGQAEHGANAYKAFQAITFDNTHSVKNTPMQVENREIINVADSCEVMLELLEL